MLLHDVGVVKGEIEQSLLSINSTLLPELMNPRRDSTPPVIPAQGAFQKLKIKRALSGLQ